MFQSTNQIYIPSSSNLYLERKVEQCRKPCDLHLIGWFFANHLFLKTQWIWVNYCISLTWMLRPSKGMISLTNHYSYYSRLRENRLRSFFHLICPDLSLYSAASWRATSSQVTLQLKLRALIFQLLLEPQRSGSEAAGLFFFLEHHHLTTRKLFSWLF